MMFEPSSSVYEKWTGTSSLHSFVRDESRWMTPSNFPNLTTYTCVQLEIEANLCTRYKLTCSPTYGRQAVSSKHSYHRWAKFWGLSYLDRVTFHWN